jgi:hypothetical protein
MLSPHADRRPAPACDPGWLLHRTLAAETATAESTAEEAVLAWLMRLPMDVDPARAAADLLPRLPRAAADTMDTRGARVLALLDEIQAYPVRRLHGMPRRRHRPAGARRRRAMA